MAYINRNKGLIRGMTTFLLLINLNMISVNASTSDDVRAYLGGNVERRIDTQSNNIQVSTTDDTKGSMESLSDKAKELKESLNSLENSYIEGLKSGLSGYRLVEILKAIDVTKSRIDENKDISSLISKMDILTSDIETQDNGVLGSYTFNIGDIGDSAISPSNKTLILTKPYGYKINADGSHNSKNTSINLLAPVGSDIKSQWNGKVAFIEDDKELSGSKVLTLYHGQNLYTVYHHVNADSDIFVGKPVSQGDVIGQIGETKNLDSDATNHLTYSIILDNKYINPLLIYGNRSRQVYMDWLSKAQDTYTVEQNEEFYYKSSMSRKNINNETNGDMPDPGVVR